MSDWGAARQRGEGESIGADARGRTADLLITNQPVYLRSPRDPA